MTYDLNELQALLAKMTRGEWQWRYDALRTDYPQWSIQPGILIADGTDGTPGGDMIDKANAAGIVALVNAARGGLIADHMALQARVAELEAEVVRLLDVLRKTADALTKHHQWHAAQTDPDPEHGYIPADEYAESGMYERTVDALDAANKAFGSVTFSSKVPCT